MQTPSNGGRGNENRPLNHDEDEERKLSSGDAANDVKLGFADDLLAVSRVPALAAQFKVLNHNDRR